MLFFLYRSHGATSAGGEGSNTHGGHVGQRIHLGIRPDIFNRVEFRSVGRKVREMQMGVVVPQRLNRTRAMGDRTIPYDDERAVKLLQKVLQKGMHQVGIDVGIGMKTEEETKPASAWGNAEGCNHGYLLVGTSLVIQPRCLSPGAPGSADKGSHHHAAFVDKDQPGLQSRCFFLMRGHSTLTQRVIPSSSRSTAFRSGFWGLHPSAWRRRPIWST